VARLLRSSDLILHTTSYLERFNRCFCISTTYAVPLLTQDYIYNTAVLTQPLATQAAGATDKPGRRMGRARSDRRRAYFDYKFILTTSPPATTDIYYNSHDRPATP